MASGTVFNVVILWNVLNKSNKSAIIQEFKGHEVIRKKKKNIYIYINFIIRDYIV